MDNAKKNLSNLADFLKSHLESVKKLVVEHQVPQVTIKADQTPVTTLDLALSSFFETLLQNKYPSSVFYSEENFTNWGYPLLALDPLDGTREFMAGRSEWAISLAHLYDEHWKGEGWIYNPLTDEVFDGSITKNFVEKDLFYGEVSRSEWDKGLYANQNDSRFSFRPMGSIAYKLGRLSAGKIDFVVSLRPKNIWDIAAGTLLCQEAGLAFYSQGKLVTEVRPYYEPPLIWCSPKLYPRLSSILESPR